MKPDPRFPDRPTHADFERLSEAVVANDTALDEGALFDEVLGQYVDVDSIMYLLKHRWGKVRHHGAETTAPENLYKASWIDGFAAAARMFASPTVKDGQHR